mgnify:CR=1 FL=1
MTAAALVVLRQTGQQFTVQKTFAVTGAPDVDTDHGTLTPTELTVVFRWISSESQQTDVTIGFGTVSGHHPVRHYFAITEKLKPRPAWINEAIADHAPDWWQA